MKTTTYIYIYHIRPKAEKRHLHKRRILEGMAFKQKQYTKAVSKRREFKGAIPNLPPEYSIDDIPLPKPIGEYI